MPNTEAPAVESDAGGKKIFLLYPQSVIHEEMLSTLIMNGFEAYTLRDHKKAVKILELFPSSILFINIDERLPEKEWETYIRDLMNNPKTKNVNIGILSNNQDKDLMQKYLTEISVPCGYIQLKLGIQESTRTMLNALEANEAKGRRKFIRVSCEDDPNVTVNFKIEKELFHGKILDISSTGFSAKIPGIQDLFVNSVIQGVQLRLHGILIMTNAVFMGIRRDHREISILVFDPSRLDQDNKMSIYQFIKHSLQQYIDQIKIN